MENFLIEETPGRVMGFLGAALFSMTVLFTVSASNASFQGTSNSLPDPFAPEKVVSAIDNMAAGYSQALASLTRPAQEALAAHVEGMKWVMAEASGPLVKTLGLEGLANPYQATSQPKVAGAFKVSGSYESISVDDLYSLFISGQ